MVIGFDGSRAFVVSKTGTENYSFQLLKALSKIDGKNRYIIYVRPEVNIGSDWPGNFSAKGGPASGWQFKPINWPRLWTQGGLALQTFQDKLDVLFVPAHTLPLFRRPGLKTVVTVHDLGSEYLPSMHQVKQRFYLSFIQKYQLQTAAKIIVVSKATRKDLEKRLGIDPEKISVVYEGYDKNLFNPAKADVLVNTLRRYDLRIKEYFLFVGTVQPRKNLERLITAFSDWLLAIGKKRKASSKQLVIAGSKGWLSEEIFKLPKRLGIEDRIKFLGFVPDKDLPGLYSGAIALTYPSLFEGFGLPILEAQACGCPVLTSNVSSMPEIAGPDAVYVNPYHVDDIVDGMRRVKESRSQRVKAGFENIKRFSWEKCAAQTLEVFENLKVKSQKSKL